MPLMSVFELRESQSMPGPLTCYDGPLTIRKILGANLSLFVTVSTRVGLAKDWMTMFN